MKNTWLVVRREYLERVRTKAFIFTTILVPALMAIAIGLPMKLATMKNAKGKRIVLVTSDAALGEAFRKQLATTSADTGGKFDISVDPAATPEERDKLRQRISNRELDGFLWASQDAVAQRKISFTGSETGDFVEIGALRRALTLAITQQTLAGRGVKSDDIDEMLKPVTLDTIQLKAGKESKLNGEAAFVFCIIIATTLYTTLILYGVTVMRAVLEEKTSRIMEVLLASVSPRALMAGKILGVGAVGLTQVLIWSLLATTVTGGQLAAAKSMGLEINVSPMVLITFPIFFVLGYLLNSAAFAAVGAAVNSEQEAQQLQIFVMMPVIFSMLLMGMVIRDPGSPMSIAFSLFPFTAPILMYLRIAVQQPPMWQIGLCIGLLLLATWGMMSLCARIYRVGILMYGKRPTLPEIVKWMRYA